MKVTIGLPVFNAAEYIEDAIKSIKAQTFKSWECIIIDDGSTDSSLEIIRSNIDERFTVISGEENMGLIKRLNQISELAVGEYIARMDSDDIMHPRRIERQVRYLDRERETDIVGSSAYLIDTKNDIYGIRNVGNDFSFNRLLLGSPFVHPSIMGRKEWFIRNKYDTNAERVEDYELWLRSYKDSRFGNIEDPLIYYREAGLPYLRKYLLTSNGMREVLKRYRSEDITEFNISRFLLLSKAKAIAFAMLHYLGKGERFMRARAREMNALEYLDASVNLSRAIGRR